MKRSLGSETPAKEVLKGGKGFEWSWSWRSMDE